MSGKVTENSKLTHANVVDNCDQLEKMMKQVSMQKFEKLFYPDDVAPKDFERLKLVGEGGYGKVFQVRKQTGEDKGTIYAMKVITKRKVTGTEKDLRHARDERKILETINSPFLCDLHYAFQTNEKLYLVLEFLHGGELYTLLERKSDWPEEYARFYLSEIILAIEHLHGHDIVYRDLKPDNVMLNLAGHVVLTDFGLCKYKLKKGEKTLTFCGTHEYMAPEMIRKVGHDHAVDVWALGILMYDMFMGGPPFTGETPADKDKSILKGKVRLPPKLSASGKDLIKRIIKRDPTLRITIPDIKEHEFFEEIDWDKLMAHDFEPPFKPTLANLEDVSHFDESFTSIAPEESPCKAIVTENEERNYLFNGFNFNRTSKTKETRKTTSAARKLTTTNNVVTAPQLQCA
ncbi:Non-specific serine/threonine protein kinase [Caenorhabditis elegans]|uniref:Non-specific serine/threonine protein kinase n=1 Tax=Caenorhabditis elegans TaxID=6239 RepID=Q21694_CAEEL|nr:Non-specific serine/threonine protein kinase [Caenorhabditis elegans]CCD62913.1 Non-specific serine/threonine protein kinase [Caenorhabditis elegans]|eukprot:NP_001024829.2 Uncharacterized protein CELE_R04A9.7 [Caenorhabditis elegans]